MCMCVFLKAIMVLHNRVDQALPFLQRKSFKSQMNNCLALTLES